MQQHHLNPKLIWHLSLPTLWILYKADTTSYACFQLIVLRRSSSISEIQTLPSSILLTTTTTFTKHLRLHIKLYSCCYLVLQSILYLHPFQIIHRYPIYYFYTSSPLLSFNLPSSFIILHISTGQLQFSQHHFT